MVLAVTTDLTNITTAESTTNWGLIGTGGGLAVEPDYYVQGSNCISVPVSGNNKKKGGEYDFVTGGGTALDFTASGAQENDLLYMWIRCSTVQLIKTIAAGGGGIRLTDGAGNWSEWYIFGSDFGFDDITGFKCFVIDPTTTPSNTSGTLDLSDVNLLGAFIETSTTAKGQNLGIDRISHGRGVIRGTGTATTGLGFKDLADWDYSTDRTNRYGMMTVREGKIFCQCKVVIGDDSGTLATTFTSNDETLVWTTPLYHDGANRVAAVPDADEDGANYWGLEIVGNGTGATNVTIGTLVGSDDGRSGTTFEVSENAELTTPARQEWRFVGDDGNVDSVDVYGSTFRNCERASPDNAIDFNGLVTADKVYACTFDACGRIDFGACEVRNSTILNSFTDTNDGAVIWDADTDVEGCSFLNNTHSIVFEASTGTPFTFTELAFNPTALAIRNEIAVTDVTVNIVDGDTPTAEDASGSTTTIISTKTITITVQDTSKVAIVGARAIVMRDALVAHTSGAGNTAGDADLVLTATIENDTPTTGTVEVLDISVPTPPQVYRYVSYTGSTFTFPAEVTFACTGGGTGQLLQDTVNDFTALDIVRGDTVRNVTDGSWANVKTITDSDNIVTTELQGGSDNTWTSGDTYSFHRLATTLVSGTDQVRLTYMNDVTNGSGVVTASVPNPSDTTMRVFVRANEPGGTDYIDQDDTVAFTAANGLTRTFTLDVDTVSTS